LIGSLKLIRKWWTILEQSRDVERWACTLKSNFQAHVIIYSDGKPVFRHEIQGGIIQVETLERQVKQ
jgi:hypothetical protein